MDNLSRDQIIDMSDEDSIGLIYSRSDLHQYLVELIDHKKCHYIHKGNDLKSYDSVEEAVRCARQKGAVKCYLCLDNTYDECGADLVSQRFSYLPINY
ncbi:hypothetical protein [Legionella sp. W05-934-2]|jgi:hypothetical protein|uniref:hypothetical protein n=1 Tax=Legionella sp. W05-934-2 TaxID=1198649 RepID=UPI0034618C8D